MTGLSLVEVSHHYLANERYFSNFARKITGNSCDAEDIVANAWLRITTYIDNGRPFYDPSKGSFKSYMARVIFQEWLREKERRRNPIRKKTTSLDAHFSESNLGNLNHVLSHPPVPCIVEMADFADFARRKIVGY